MQFDHSQEYLRLTGEYRARSDEELLKLNLDFADLTETAQQVLSAELHSRGLDKKIEEEKQAVAGGSFPSRVRSAFLDRAAESMRSDPFHSESIEPVPDNENPETEDVRPHDYIWKTMLCEGLEYDQSWQIYEVLRRAGIESWIERPGGRPASLVAHYSDGDIRVVVAADELDRARAIIANPIPQDIIDESHETVPDYEPPRCPSCGAEDPVLESAEPVNSWKCENCGGEWTDPAPDARPAGGPF
jgi:hypothetical protein